eukprot:COSAG01_NODE_4678_length_4822_cov_5.658129_6_plen_58_part_00
MGACITRDVVRTTIILVATGMGRSCQAPSELGCSRTATSYATPEINLPVPGLHAKCK